MGGNGTFSKGHDIPEGSRQYRTIDTIPAGGGFPEVAIVEMKNLRSAKLPEESHSPNRVYAVIYPNGSDVKEIGIYKDHLRTAVIHTQPHKDLGAHYHEWKDGKQMREAHPLTSYMERLLQHVRNYRK